MRVWASGVDLLAEGDGRDVEEVDAELTRRLMKLA